MHVELTVKSGLLTLVQHSIVELSEPVDVMLGDGKILNAVGSGVVTVHTNLANGKQQECKLHNVLFVPNVSYNLLSVSTNRRWLKQENLLDSKKQHVTFLVVMEKLLLSQRKLDVCTI